MPLYRLTFRDKNRKKLELEVIASSMRAAIPNGKEAPQN